MPYSVRSSLRSCALFCVFGAGDPYMAIEEQWYGLLPPFHKDIGNALFSDDCIEGNQTWSMACTACSQRHLYCPVLLAFEIRIAKRKYAVE